MELQSRMEIWMVGGRRRDVGEGVVFLQAKRIILVIGVATPLGEPQRNSDDVSAPSLASEKKRKVRSGQLISLLPSPSPQAIVLCHAIISSLQCRQ